MKKAIVYYTDSRLEEELDEAVRAQILKAADGIPIISVSQKRLQFGTNICVGIKPRCYLSLYEQLLTGLEAAPDDAIIYLCEHDVFYHPSQFKFVPPRVDRIYFNLNRYYWAKDERYYVKAIGKRALSECVSHKATLTTHVRHQVYSRACNLPSVCKGPFETFESGFPNVDIRHGGNFSNSERFKDPPEKFFEIMYWGATNEFQEKTGYRNKFTDTAETLEGLPFKKPFYRNDIAKMFNQFGFKKGAEIGVKLGKYSEALCKAIPGLKLKCVDPYLPGPEVEWDDAEDFFGKALKLLKDYDAEIIKKTSRHAAAEDVPKWSLDFVYIDANHEFNHVMQDIIIWSERVRKGGIVSGHDYDNDDVKTAVDAYVKIHGYNLYITDKGKKYPDSAISWFFAK